MRKGTKEDKDVALKVERGGTLTWKCSACGADNDAFLQFCNECGGERAGDPATPKRPESETFEDRVVLPKPSPEPEPEDIEGEEQADEAVEAEKDEEDEEKPEVSIQAPTIISSPLSALETTPQAQSKTSPEPPSETATEAPPEPLPWTPAGAPSQETSQAPSQTMGQGRYYIVFVNTPAQSLIKAKVPIELDIFPVVSIGRSPENVIVIPDQEVSRVHAELTAEGTKLLLKDLKSKNGTYVYNGKKFEQVTDSVEVKPNTILKFGTGTIVRLVSE